MVHFAGLDVSVKETSVCIVDETGKIVREVKVASEPAALLAVLRNAAYRFKRIGLEAWPLSQWLYSAFAEAGLPVICVETRHMRVALYPTTQAATTKNARKRSLSKWRRDIAPGHIEVRRHATNIHQPYARRRKANVGGSRGQGRKLRHPLLRRRGRCRWSLSGLPTAGRRAHRQHRPRHRQGGHSQNLR